MNIFFFEKMVRVRVHTWRARFLFRIPIRVLLHLEFMKVRVKDQP